MCMYPDVPQAKLVSLKGMHRRDIVRGLWAGTLVIGTVGASGCSSIAKVFTPSDEQLVELSAQAWAETKQQTPISKDAKANARLQSIGPRIAAVANIPNAQWEFVVFDSKEKNAFVLPGGKVGFYKGLIDFSDNDDQIAAVLGHEVGHVKARHAARRIGQETATGLLIQGGGMLLGSTVKMSDEMLKGVMAAAGAGAQVGVLLPFSRDNESEADLLGADYMHAAGFDVKQSVRLWGKMAAASQGGGQEWMSTHPDPSRRARELKTYIETKGYAKF